MLHLSCPCTDNLSCGSANAVCGSDVSSLGISDSEHPNMNNESTNKVNYSLFGRHTVNSPIKATAFIRNGIQSNFMQKR